MGKRKTNESYDRMHIKNVLGVGALLELINGRGIVFVAQTAYIDRTTFIKEISPNIEPNVADLYLTIIDTYNPDTHVVVLLDDATINVWNLEKDKIQARANAKRALGTLK